jgi:Holliday junction resolvase RusA-like endonuclease
MIHIDGEIHSSKNSRRIMRTRKGTPFVGKSASSKADESIFFCQLNNQRERWEQMVSGKQWPIKLVFAFRRKTRQRFDYINMAQGLCDAMIKAEYLPDDSADYVIPVFVPYSINKSNPGCDLWIAEENP